MSEDRSSTALPHEVERSFGMFPRRACLDQITPLERGIYAAGAEIEAMPADARLTLAQIKLSEARDLIADYLEGRNPR